jgi:hypothetical protein
MTYFIIRFFFFRVSDLAKKKFFFHLEERKIQTVAHARHLISAQYKS